MKATLLISLLIAVSGRTQTALWPTENAEWYYTITDMMNFNGYTSYKIEHDTTVSGKTCQVYSRNAQVLFTGLPTPTVFSSDEEVHFIINLEDSVLHVYNQTTSIFDTIVDFKAQVGDTWRSYFHDAHCAPQEGDPFIITEVMSKGTETINGLNLIKFTLKRHGSPEFIDTFYQLIGNINGNFIDNKSCQATDFLAETSLRCFTVELNGNHYEYAPFNEACNYLPNVGLNQLSNNTIKVINPVINNEIHFFGVNLNDVENILITDLQGKKLNIETIEQHGNDVVLQMSKQLNQGIFLYQIVTNRGIFKGKLNVY